MASSVPQTFETLELVNDTPLSKDASGTSKQSQSSGNSSSSDSHSAAPDAVVIDVEGDSDEEEEEEQGECGFCLFMKGGGCKEEFISWEKCVEEAEKTGEDVVNKCMEVTSLLKKCMDAHADYYEPILRAEREMAEAVSDVDTEDQENKSAVSDVKAEESEKSS
ncbi:hypothetical protein HPP92_026214 [Vanilla planifolia]|uniref:GCK domain-containing protein n=1 Tax=Vanilla planifolia TaxID=51239 RepID=A0A835PD51_VANPL|nr:hypothetical protein HPP92_026214 [Vanilla planifolia]